MHPEPFFIRNVIFADDDEDDRSVFQYVINEIDPDIRIEFVSNGIQLVDLLQHFMPDMIFLDLEMPYKNGLECLVEIREHPRLNTLPVIVFSSTTRPANIQTAYEMGAHLFLIKASTVQEYKQALQTILELNWNQPEKVREQYCVNGRYTAFT